MYTGLALDGALTEADENTVTSDICSTYFSAFGLLGFLANVFVYKSVLFLEIRNMVTLRKEQDGEIFKKWQFLVLGCKIGVL